MFTIAHPQADPPSIGFTKHTRMYISNRVKNANPTKIIRSVLVRFSMSLRIDSLIPMVLSICIVRVLTFLSV